MKLMTETKKLAVIRVVLVVVAVVVVLAISSRQRLLPGDGQQAGRAASLPATCCTHRPFHRPNPKTAAQRFWGGGTQGTGEVKRR